jgi:hypothetical protein
MNKLPIIFNPQVTSEVVIKAFPVFQGVNGVNASFIANSTQSFSQFVSVWLGMQADLAEAGLSGVSNLVKPLYLLIAYNPNHALILDVPRRSDSLY